MTNFVPKGKGYRKVSGAFLKLKEKETAREGEIRIESSPTPCSVLAFPYSINASSLGFCRK
jgi:hypothetical protein